MSGFRENIFKFRRSVYLLILIWTFALPANWAQAVSAASVLNPLTDHVLTASHSARVVLENNYGKLPLAFEPNQGQTDPEVKFLSHGGGYSFFLTGSEAVFVLKKHKLKVPAALGQKVDTHEDVPQVLRFQMVGANPNAVLEGQAPLPGVSHYFITNDRSKWRSNVGHYARVAVHDIYQGIDVVYYGNQQKMEYDFQVRPGADPGQIHLHVAGADDVRTDGNGDLRVTVQDRGLTLKAPKIYQEATGGQTLIEGRFVVVGKDEVVFEVEDYDKSKKLVIDPVIDYGTYVGGSGGDVANGVAVDSAGNVYVTGFTTGNYPTTSGAYQTTVPIKAYTNLDNVFVSKLDPTGSTLLFSTYLCGTQQDIGWGIAVDSSDNVYVTGQAGSGFPTTAGAYQTTFSGNVVFGSSDYYFGDAFLSKLTSDGTTLLYSTYLGGTGADGGTGVFVDAAKNVYLSGWTTSTNFPTSAGAFKTTYGAGDKEDMFAAKLNPAGNGSADLIYSTLLGECLTNVFPHGSYVQDNLTVDSAGNAYVVGATTGNNFSTTAGAFQTALSGAGDNFALKLNATGTGLVWSTYVGPSTGYGGYGVVLDASNNVYFTGTSGSASYPTSPGAYVTAYTSGLVDGIVAEISSTGSSLLYSTFIGQMNNAAGYPTGIQLDNCGNIYVTGYTSYTGFPITAGAWDSSFSGSGFIGYFLELDPALSGNAQLVFSSFFGNTASAYCQGMAKDANGNFYIAGVSGGGFSTTAGSYQTAYAGSPCCSMGDAFVAKIGITSCVAATTTSTMTSTSTSTPAVTATFTSTPTVSYTFTATSSSTMTSTSTFTSSPTLSDTPVPLATATSTPTLTGTSTFTLSPTSTSTLTPTNTATTTNSPVPSATSTDSPTAADTYTSTCTASNTNTLPPTSTPTLTVTNTVTYTPTHTATPTVTLTVTNTFTITSTPTITATPIAVPDEFFISKNVFSGNSTVKIIVGVPDYPGQFDVNIFNSAGEHIKNLASVYLEGPLEQTYSWDGRNKYGDRCASGIYVIYVTEPLRRKEGRVIFIN